MWRSGKCAVNDMSSLLKFFRAIFARWTAWHCVFCGYCLWCFLVQLLNLYFVSDGIFAGTPGSHSIQVTCKAVCFQHRCVPCHCVSASICSFHSLLPAAWVGSSRSTTIFYTRILLYRLELLLSNNVIYECSFILRVLAVDPEAALISYGFS